MKYLSFVQLILFPVFAFSDGMKEIEEVGDLVWKNRIILIWSDANTKFQKELEAMNHEIEDRDIVWFIISGKKVTSNYKGKIANSFAANTTGQYSQSGKKVILIGKDGGVKNGDDEFNLDGLFQMVDSMPMRINEMNEK